jgi:DNA-binding CsgD family transcriptional regulator
MALTLTSRDVAAFAALQEALLTPLDHPSVDQWCLAVLKRAETLFQADRSAMMVPLDSQVHYLSESIDPHFMRAFEDGIADFQPGAIRFSEAAVDKAWDARRSKSLEVWSIPMLHRMMGVPLERTPMYHEVVKPAGLTHGAVATTAVPAGEAFLGASRSQPTRARFGEAEWLQLMRMVLPAFKAGVGALVRLQRSRSALAQTLDQLGEALLVVDAEGRVLHQTVRLANLLASDADAARILGEMESLARSLLNLRKARVDARFKPVGTHEVRTATARYSMRASYLNSGLLGPRDAVLVALERTTPAFPSVDTLVEQHGLTRREAEVTLLLAQGLSNVEIATRLGVSPHTVRHHAEWVFTKMGIHSRKALGLALMALQA